MAKRGEFMNLDISFSLIFLAISVFSIDFFTGIEVDPAAYFVYAAVALIFMFIEHKKIFGS